MEQRSTKHGACLKGSTWLLQIQAAKDPERHYRLDDVNLSMPKWGSACGWDSDDDQKLLLGCYW